MISGFNTDVEFEDVVYHVQTEDKGSKSRLIVSLVYDGGTILASKRAPYGDLMNGVLDEKKLADRLQRQHKLMCAAVRAGRMEQLKQMAAADRKKVPAPAAVGSQQAGDIPIQITQISSPALEADALVETSSVVTAAIPHQTLEDVLTLPAPQVIPVDAGDVSLDVDIINDEMIFDAVSVIEDEEAILIPEAIAVISELSGTVRPTHTKLSVDLLGETKFKGGDRRTVTIMICRGTERRVIADAQIMIKVLGSAFRPVIFHATSDENGLAKVHLQIPHFGAGRAALLVRAMSGGEEVEFRRAVTPA